MCGTLDYMAPELLSETLSPHYHGTPVDLWALGVVAHELLTATTPFYHTSASDTRNAIVGRGYRPPRTFAPRATAFVRLQVPSRQVSGRCVTKAGRRRRRRKNKEEEEGGGGNRTKKPVSHILTDAMSFMKPKPGT